ncbi:hypothetical protein ACIA8C_06455 [Nocardia sp. NPDC051321]|uniref:hypothetical protein n=1 Tax=Nocardia sp. NPDC051321 TaxID=3364323 RepID=UPI0037A3E7C0
MIGKIGAAAAAGLTATLLLTGAAGANTFQTDQTIGGFTVASQTDNDPTCPDGKSGTDGSKQGESGTTQEETTPGAQSGGAGDAKPALPTGLDTGSATGKTTGQTGDGDATTSDPKKCKTTPGTDTPGTGTDTPSTGAETPGTGGAGANGNSVPSTGGAGTNGKSAPSTGAGTGTGTGTGTQSDPSGATDPAPAPGGVARKTR